MSGGLITIQTLFNNFISMLFTTEIMTNFTLGWALVYLIILSIIVGFAFHG